MVNFSEGTLSTPLEIQNKTQVYNLLARFQNAFWVIDDHACILQSLQDVGYAVRHLVGGGPQDQNVVQINETKNPPFFSTIFETLS